MNVKSEAGIEARRREAYARRYKKAVVQTLNLEEIHRSVEEMWETTSNIKYWSGGLDETMLEALLGDEDDVYAFRMAFSDLDADLEHFYNDLDEAYIPENFDSFFVGIGAGRSFGLMGYDDFEGDYYGLHSSFEERWAEKEDGKRLMRMTKAEIIEAAGACFSVAVNYLALRSRFDDLKAAMEIITGANHGLLDAVKKIEDAYERASKEDFYRYADSTQELDRIARECPDEVWLQ